MTTFLVVLSALLAALLGISVYYNFRHGSVIVEMEDACSEALDILDETYRVTTDVLEIPIMLDSPEVRSVVNQIKRSRDAVLFVSNILAEPFGGIIEEEEEGDV